MKNKLMKVAAILAVAVSLVALVSCGEDTGSTKWTPTSANALVSGGASFPKHFYMPALKAYADEYGVQVDYKAEGSGYGQGQLAAKTIHYAGSDEYLEGAKLEPFGGETVLHIPTCIGPIAVVYNLPGNPKLKLTGQVVSDMYKGKIKKWNDPRVKQLNPDVDLPAIDVTLVARKGKSGTTKNFTLFLERSSSDFGKSFKKPDAWPYQEGMIKGKKNDGVANNVKKIEGAIGYVELAYVETVGLTAASIENAQGEFVYPTLESASLAAAGDFPDDTKVYVAYSKAKGAYPVTAITWLLFYKDLEKGLAKNKDEAIETLRVMWWLIHEGQEHTSPGYAKLPKTAVEKAEVILKSATYEGKAVDFLK